MEERPLLFRNIYYYRPRNYYYNINLISINSKCRDNCVHEVRIDYNNNTTNNIQYIINSPTASSIGHLTFELQKDILDKGLNSLVYLIEMINFNELVPENHSYCVTAINDKHASMIDTKTNSIIKAEKNELYDKVLTGNLSKLEKLSADPVFSVEEKTKYIETMERLKKILFQSKKGIKKYYSDINILSYNNKDLIQETWNGLKKLDEIVISNNFEQHVPEISEQDNDLSSDCESDDDVNTEKLKKFQQKQ